MRPPGVVLFIILLCAPALPAAGGASGCKPAADPSARTLALGEMTFHAAPDPIDRTYYVRSYALANNQWVELWRETNAVDGLQRDRTWNCGEAGDTLVVQGCVGRTCTLIGL